MKFLLMAGIFLVEMGGDKNRFAENQLTIPKDNQLWTRETYMFKDAIFIRFFSPNTELFISEKTAIAGVDRQTGKAVILPVKVPSKTNIRR